MRFFVASCLGVALLVSFFSNVADARCLDESGDAEKNFNLYVGDNLCLETLRDWAFTSPERLEALDGVMARHLSDYPKTVYTLMKALDKKVSDEGLDMKTDSVTYGMLLEDGVKWNFIKLLSGFVVVGGGSYYLVQKALARVRAFNRLILPFRFNPAIFVVGMVVAGVTGSAAMEGMDALYQGYLEQGIERNLGRLEGGRYGEAEKMEMVESIVEDAMGLVAIENQSFFAAVLLGLQGVDGISESRDFFRGLVVAHPWLLEEEIGKDKISLLLEKLESAGVQGGLQPLRDYLVIKDTMKSLSRFYVGDTGPPPDEKMDRFSFHVGDENHLSP